MLIWRRIRFDELLRAHRPAARAGTYFWTFGIAAAKMTASGCRLVMAAGRSSAAATFHTHETVNPNRRAEM
jgi:hypothetical protein